VKTWKIALAAAGCVAAFTTLAPGYAAPPAAPEAAPPTRESFIEDPTAPRKQSARHDLTIVIYSDYQCPYCRKMHPVLQQAMAEDRKLRLIYRDWPIFGPVSVSAARLAIASKWQNRHEPFHEALMLTSGKLNDASIRSAAKRAGVDWARLQADLKSHGPEIDALIARTSKQAAYLGLQGTPALIIGPYLVPGAMDLAAVRETIREARANPAGAPGEAIPPVVEAPGL
jgi:protein-disulfide isomerase